MPLLGARRGHDDRQRYSAASQHLLGRMIICGCFVILQKGGKMEAYCGVEVGCELSRQESCVAPGQPWLPPATNQSHRQPPHFAPATKLSPIHSLRPLGKQRVYNMALSKLTNIPKPHSSPPPRRSSSTPFHRTIGHPRRPNACTKTAFSQPPLETRHAAYSTATTTNSTFSSQVEIPRHLRWRRAHCA